MLFLATNLLSILSGNSDSSFFGDFKGFWGSFPVHLLV